MALLSVVETRVSAGRQSPPTSAHLAWCERALQLMEERDTATELAGLFRDQLEAALKENERLKAALQRQVQP